MLKNIIAPSNLLAIVGAFTLSFSLAWISNGYANVRGWFSFLVVLGLVTALLWLGWRSLKAEAPPGWLLWLLVGAALLRLILGVFWFVALPVWGYDTPVNQAGYVMSDAFKRDQVAWEFAESGDPLYWAFGNYSSTDQYGGLLFMSGLVYRYLGGAMHQPLLMVLLTAAFSALGVLYTWAFTKRLWGQAVGQMAAWMFALYPDAVLLGSSQMREAYLMALSMIAAYKILCYWKARTRIDLIWVGGALALSVLISPPFAALLCGLLVVEVLALSKWRLLSDRRFWIITVSFFVVGAVIFVLIVPNAFSWFEVGRWQKYVSESASGWVERQFERMVEWTHVPFLLAYGVFRPLLPSALIANGAPIWRAIGVWRALGWTLLLALLLYATLLSVRRMDKRRVAGSLLMVIWAYILIASYRGGGDLWDNPRYRAIFLGIQVALAAWAWAKQRELNDPWLRRAIGAAAMIVLWFIPWYLRRYAVLPFEWSVVDLPDVLGLGFFSAALFTIWDWAREEFVR
ncbi:MAG: glycosyltransferase family 39 protein [Anaerolineales bacterium]|nr:glycosyltransferase family 39 protein [Anaerolineales bacterium]